MAEALGVAVNIAAVLQLATEIAQLSYNYARDVKNAPKTQKQYLQEVSALMEVLFRVEQAIHDAESTDLSLLPERPPSVSDDTLMDCYKALSGLQFDLQKRRSRFLQPFHEKEWRAHIDMLHKFRSLFADFLASCILVTGSATYKKVSLLNQEQDRSILLTYLPPSTTTVRQRPAPCPGTGAAFLKQDAVQEWIGRSSDFLWCYGPPGVGKSCLASLVIDDLLRNRVPSECPVVTFFCDFSSQDQQNTLNILHHLLRQIIEQGTPEMLTTIKEACKDPGKLQNATEVAQLIATAGLSQPIHLVVDALDEIRDPTALLSHLSSFALTGMSVLVTSRDLPHIRKKMKMAAHIEIVSDPRDLKLYVESRFRDSDFAEDVEEEPSLIDDVVAKSGNLFLLARLLLDDILELSSINQIRKAIAKPRGSLEQAFEATLDRIDAQSKTRSSLARRLLGWITFAGRRLKMGEIICAFAVEDEDEFDPGNGPNPDVLLRSCLGLVVVDPSDKTVGLVHTTAYEFFKAGKISEMETNMDIAGTCLRYLTMKHLAEPCTSATHLSQRLREMRFLEYAATYWGRHISRVDPKEELAQLILNLLHDHGLRNSAFQALQYRDDLSDESLAEQIFQSMPTDERALHIAAYWGLTHTAETLLATGEVVTSLDSHKWTALHWACSRNHDTLAEMLLRNKADPKAKDIQGWTPLFWAAFVGNSNMVRLLLDHGADHLARSSLGWTALHWAVSSGHSECVKVLLEHHAQSEPEQPQFHQMSVEEVVAYAESLLPLEIAADGNDANIFDLLVQHLQTPGGEVGDAQFNTIWSTSGFDSPISMNPWRTLTKGEQHYGREYSVPTLSPWNVNGPGGYRADPVTWKSVLLLSAIRDEQLASVQLLIQSGADVQYGNVLRFAACREDPRFVECLLKAGADPNEYDWEGRTALHDAVLNGFIDTIAALIDGGADVNQPMRDEAKTRNTWRRGMYNTLDGSTPLIQACGFSFFDPKSELAVNIARLLLSRGADAALQDSSGMTALHYAVMRPYPALIKLLIDAGCPLDIPEEDGRLPIHILATCQDKYLSESDLRETIKLILGANPSDTARSLLNTPAIGRQGIRRKDSNLGDTSNPTEAELAKGRTPMHIALKNNRWRVAVFFYEFGAQIPRDLELGPILASAAEDLDVNVVDLLLDHGVKARDSLIPDLVSAFITKCKDGYRPDDRHALFEDILGKVVNAGANIDYRSPDGDTPFTVLIAASGVTEPYKVLRRFVALGADVLAPSSKAFDPILTAALYGGEQVVHYLIECAKDANGQIHWTRELTDVGQEGVTDMLRICRALQKAEALDNTNSDGRTLLHLAAECGNAPLVEALLSCGARTDIEDEKGLLPVHSAGFAQQSEALKTLLFFTADELSQTNLPAVPPNKTSLLEALAKPNDIRLNVLHCAIQENNVQMVEHLLTYGMDPTTEMPNGWNAGPILCDAAYKGRSELVATLLAHGANVVATDKYGWNALHNACYSGHTDIAMMLMKAGADVHTPTVEWNNSSYKPTGIYQSNPWTGTALHLAVMAGNAQLVKTLLNMDVDIRASTYCGQEYFCTPGHGPTALHLALDTGIFYARKGQALDKNRLTIAQWLVDRGEMVHGVIGRFKMRDVLRFKEFPGLWDALREGEKVAQRVGN
ncbi:ankyrin repeat-containing domain protein [Aspergillus carlsbadensis]|nr:ankyrin repeat-containing domain protein [Aspergillus carlsbadensis]